ncbi:hypothetical protein IT82_06060 [Listeria monocytogenes]|nr:hypothetical protein [Listeria monocytogenes]EAC8328490.1 hypothetical protein [Listeria monocytogenes]EAC8635970.1 hypothetical protein [Listeria monocytogenes]
MVNETLRLGLFESPKKFEQALTKITVVPETVVATDINTGKINEGTDSERDWANALAVDPELLEKFESIGEENSCPTFKIKLKNFHGQKIDNLVGKELKFSNYEVSFQYDKFKQAIGLSLVLELENIELS